MTVEEPGKSFDERVGKATERLLRKITRRDALRAATVGGAATVAALTLGQRPASAVTCECGPSHYCSYYGASCPCFGCPSGWYICKSGTCSPCVYSSGTWVSCSGLGKCGYGYRLCYDCHKDSTCTVCTCLSCIACANCCAPADMRAEHKRIQALTAAAS